MRKSVILVLTLIVLLLAVSCKQEIDCRLSLPSWTRGNWTVKGSITYTGEESLTLSGSYTITSDNISGTIRYETGTVLSVDWKRDIEEDKDFIKDFTQSSSSSEYSITLSAKDGDSSIKEILKLTRNDSTISYSEIYYLNDLLYATIQGTLSPR